MTAKRSEIDSPHGGTRWQAGTRIDPGLLLSIERKCNGANAHIVREYAHAYEMPCSWGVEERMNRARRQLESELIKAEYLRSEDGRTFDAQAEENVRVI